MGGMLVIISILLLYFMPAIIAARRGHVNANSICVINCFFGWTFVGWVLALAMAVSGNVERAR